MNDSLKSAKNNLNNALLPTNQAILVFLAFAFSYFMSSLIRAITATISPVLTVELSLQARDLGLLSGGYFLGFAVMQLPLGKWLDRFGPKKVIICFLSVAAPRCPILRPADLEHRAVLPERQSTLSRAAHALNLHHPGSGSALPPRRQQAHQQPGAKNCLPSAEEQRVLSGADCGRALGGISLCPTSLRNTKTCPSESTAGCRRGWGCR